MGVSIKILRYAEIYTDWAICLILHSDYNNWFRHLFLFLHCSLKSNTFLHCDFSYMFSDIGTYKFISVDNNCIITEWTSFLCALHCGTCGRICGKRVMMLFVISFNCTNNIIIIDKSLGTVGCLLLQGHSRRPKWK